MEVQRINVSVVSGNEVMDSINIETILDQAIAPQERLQSDNQAPEVPELSTTP